MWREQSAPVRAEGSPGAGGDSALVAAVAQGNREALGALYDLHAPVLFGLAKRMLGSAAAAEDLLHDVFLEVWQHAAAYTPQRGSVRAWLLVRARSRALDRLGRGAREARATERLSTEPAPAVALTPTSTLDGARLRHLAGALPADLVAVLDLTYFEGLSASEIAQRLSIPAGTVKSRLARALEALRETMAAARGGEP